MTRKVAVAIAVIAGAAGCGSRSVVPAQATESEASPPAVLGPVRPHFVPGEQMTWKVAIGGVEVGELALAVGEPGDAGGRSIIIVRGRVQSSGALSLVKAVHDETETWVDVATGRPVYHRTEDKVASASVEVDFTAGGFDVAERTSGQDEVQRQEVPGTTVVFDMYAALLALRGWDAPRGERTTAYVLRYTRVWQARMSSSGYETISVPYGELEAQRIDGTAVRLSREFEVEADSDRRDYSIWFADDPARMPLLIVGKTDFGDVRVTLVDYQRPGGR